MVFVTTGNALLSGVDRLGALGALGGLNGDERHLWALERKGAMKERVVGEAWKLKIDPRDQFNQIG